ATSIGLDIAKNVFEVHGIDQEGRVVLQRTIRRRQVIEFFSKIEPTIVGIEACGTSHFWARELTKIGHDVRLMPPVYVKPYVKRGKSDRADAAAICEAVTRPSMRFVPIKSEEQQSMLSLHRARALLVKQRTQIVNMLRGLLAEFGIVVPKGIGKITQLAERIASSLDPGIPSFAMAVFVPLADQLCDMDKRVTDITKAIMLAAKSDERARRLQQIPGIGPITSSAILATVGTPEQFQSGRDFAAWLGLTPLNKSSGGKQRLGRISKMGDRYIRRLLIGGMTSRVRFARSKPETADPWLLALLERKPARLATVAMANKAARIIWAMLTKNESYKPMAA
ncbi:MAG: IS110 family transposase, partial [Planctomycetales bacterium]|nr:IS110 family transposase [Planctomycetales bacterium]